MKIKETVILWCDFVCELMADPMDGCDLNKQTSFDYFPDSIVF